METTNTINRQTVIVALQYNDVDHIGDNTFYNLDVAQMEGKTMEESIQYAGLRGETQAGK